jgi:MtN3 and saliva related transmembrane protein
VIELIGILAGCLTTLSWVPQLVRTRRRGTADDISGHYLLTFGTGVAGWLVYGLAKSDVAVIFANALTFTLLLGLVWMKYVWRTAPSDYLDAELTTLGVSANRGCTAPPRASVSRYTGSVRGRGTPENR